MGQFLGYLTNNLKHVNGIIIKSLACPVIKATFKEKLSSIEQSHFR